MATACCIILMEILYGFDFSVFGFLVCTAILGFGMDLSFPSVISSLKISCYNACWYVTELGKIGRAWIDFGISIVG
jgi:hypothetical protein